MLLEKINREMVYLCIGDEIEQLDRSILTLKDFKGIIYFEVDGFRLIREDGIIYCSCNSCYCWHIFKVALAELN